MLNKVVLQTMAWILLSTTFCCAQTSVIPYTQNSSGSGSTPVTSTSPLPIGVYGGSSATSGYVLTSNGPGSLATFQAGGGGSISGTPGSVFFAGATGTSTQNNANFFWDNTNYRLGIGTNSPAYSLDTGASGTVAAQQHIVTSIGSSITTSGSTPVTSFSAGTTGFTPSTATTGAVTLAGTLGVGNGGTGTSNQGDATTNLTHTFDAGSCGNSSAPSWCSGSDVGAWINAAVTHAGSAQGKIILNPQTTYNYTASITIPNNIILDCQGATLNYTPTTGAALITAEASWMPYTTKTNHVVQHCQIQHSSGYSSGNTNVGIYAGGDPNGVITPSTYWSPGTMYDDVDVSGFYRAYQYGNNTWAITLNNVHFHDNYDGIYVANGNSNSGETMKVYASNFYDNSHCGANFNEYDEWGFFGDHFDYNGGGAAGGVNGTGAGVCGVQIQAKFYTTHFEQQTGPFIRMTGASVIKIEDSTLWLASTTAGSEQGLFYLLGNGYLFDRITIKGLEASGNYAPSYYVYTNGVGDLQETYEDTVWQNTSVGNPSYSDSTTHGIIHANYASANFNGSVTLTPAGVSIGTGTGFSGASSPTNGLAVQGSVGIGTNTPSFPLDVVNTTNSSDISARVYNKVLGKGAFLVASANSNYSSTQYYGTGVAWVAGQVGSNAFQIQDTTDSTTPLYIAKGSPTNSVVIGTTGVSIGTFSTWNAQTEIENTASYANMTTNPVSNAQLLLGSSGGTTGQRTYIGSYYTYGTGNASSIQASSFYSSLDHSSSLLLNPTGGGVSIGSTTSPPANGLMTTGVITIGTSTSAVSGASISMQGAVAVGATNMLTSLGYTYPNIMSTAFQNSLDTTEIFAPGNAAASDANPTLYVMGNQTVGIGTGKVGSTLGAYGNVAIGTSYASLSAPTNGLIVQGNVSIGTTATSGALNVNGTINATTLTTTNGVALTNLAQIATNTILGNSTSGTANVTALAIGGCSSASSALIWTTNTGFGCNTSITANAVPAANLTGTTLASGVTGSSLTSVGTIATGVWNAGAVTSSGAVTGTSQVVTGNTAPTNGIYLPAANTIGFAANSVDTMALGTTGLAIGTSYVGINAPTNGLSVQGTVSIGTSTAGLTSSTPGLGLQYALNTAYSATAPQSNDALVLYNSDTTAGDAVTIYMRNDTSASTAACAMSMLPTASGSGSLRFNCRNSGTFADDMIIFPSGAIGIGTATIRNSATLDVNGSLNANAFIGAESIGNYQRLVGKYSSTTAAIWNADELTVETALGGTAYKLASYNQTLTVSGTGAGGMDTGSPPTSGWLYIYAIYKPSTGTQSILGTTTGSGATIYAGSNLPSGYTASYLIGAVYMNASAHFTTFWQQGTTVYVPATSMVSGTAQASYASVSMTAIVPPNAKCWSGNIGLVATVNNASAIVAGDSSGTGGSSLNSNNGSLNVEGNLVNIPLITAQTMYYTTGSASSSAYINLTAYTF